MEQEPRKRKLDDTRNEPQNAPILCASNCGFFGGSSTNNLCSKCYKEYLLKQSKTIVENTAFADSEKDLDQTNKFDEGTTSEVSQKQPANRCNFCKKRVGLTGFKCKCGQIFCSQHRYSDMHNCVVDFKSAGQDAIAKANPVVMADKIKKI